MRADLTVVTPTIPGRTDLCARAMRSVFDQTLQPQYHIIVAQDLSDELAQIQHVSQMRNYWIDRCETEWIAFLDDDNYWLPHHIETLHNELARHPDTDCVYSDHSLSGDTTYNVNDKSTAEIRKRLEESNLSDINGFIFRTRFLQSVGGFCRDRAIIEGPFRRGRWEGEWRVGYIGEEQELLYRLFLAGAHFRTVEEKTWVISLETYDPDSPFFDDTRNIPG